MGLDDLRKYLESFWSEVLTSYGAEIVRRMTPKKENVMLDPIVKTIEVPCSQAKAFDVFLNEMDSWWPLGKFSVSAMGGAPAKAIRVDAKPGGQIVEIGPNGTEHLWGTIKSYQPHDFVSMDFHFAPPGEKVDARTLVESAVTAIGKSTDASGPDPEPIGKPSARRPRCCVTVDTARRGSLFSRVHSSRLAADEKDFAIRHPCPEPRVIGCRNWAL